ncbi:MAG: 2-oxo acid dehydrogenase subunit E2 [Bacteroidales bacterium]|jgi:pyruvate dehydrogenase E2 component (dihydrolipoamide acetyltransferase)|nr:2-oxo acid dehydrogenase subunit E2 [Bacteroidales bacterium]
MAVPIIMPRQGQSVESCIITKWFRNKGDSVAKGDILLSYETDKAAFDIESPCDGTILEVCFSEGDEVPVLANIAVIGAAGEDFSPPAASGKTDKPVFDKTGNTAETVKKQEAQVVQVNDIGERKIRISPRAKRIAVDKGINFSLIAGSGPNGRIVAADMEKAIATPIVSAEKTQETHEYSDQPLSNVRKLIAKSMHASLQNSAQLTHHMSADVRKLLDTRSKIKKSVTTQDITLNDMICWCVIRALEEFPEANSHFLNDKIRTFNKVHLGIAVDTPRGLMVPVVKNASGMDIAELSKELKHIAESCRRGNIDPELIKSEAASFTVSNLGNYGVEMFTPVINLPQVAILGVCSVVNRPAVIDSNILAFIPCMGLSLTYDHRAIDGGPATLFLKEIKKQIEEFKF